MNAIYAPTRNYIDTNMCGTASFGISKDAEFLQVTEASIIQYREENSSSIKQAFMRRFLLELYDSCSTDDWDGYGAKALKYESYLSAFQLINCLPSNIPLPDIDSTSDGEIIFQWYVRKSYAFTLTIDSANRLFYAGLFGKSRADGIEYFDGYLPEQVFNNIQRLFQKLI